MDKQTEQLAAEVTKEIKEIYKIIDSKDELTNDSSDDLQERLYKTCYRIIKEMDSETARAYLCALSTPNLKNNTWNVYLSMVLLQYIIVMYNMIDNWELGAFENKVDLKTLFSFDKNKDD